MAGNCVHVTKAWDVFRVNRSVFVIMTELACCGCSQSGQTVKLFLLTLLLKTTNSTQGFGAQVAVQVVSQT